MVWLCQGEEAVEAGLTEGLRKIFSDQLLLPLYPLKAVTQSLLTQEIYSGLQCGQPRGILPTD